MIKIKYPETWKLNFYKKKNVIVLEAINNSGGSNNHSKQINGNIFRNKLN